MKITKEQSRQIYELASDPAKKMTNAAIGLRFGISESAVRHHTRKWEKTLKTISKNNVKVNTAIAANKINVLEEGTLIMKVIKSSVQEARNRDVSPEKLSSLYNAWIKILELLSDMDIVRRIEALEAAAETGKP